jgi:multisubunit Na+/H+ antiporter MnhC subunit
VKFQCSKDVQDWQARCSCLSFARSITTQTCISLFLYSPYNPILSTSLAASIMHLGGLLTTVFLSVGLSSSIVIPRSSTVPAPTNDLDLTKRQVSPIPYGLIITHCNIPNTVALTFDDGPFIYTGQILDTLSKHGARATFFLNGVNKGNIDSFHDLVQRTISEGHQLGSHTYVHNSVPNPATTMNPPLPTTRIQTR